MTYPDKYNTDDLDGHKPLLKTSQMANYKPKRNCECGSPMFLVVDPQQEHYRYWICLDSIRCGKTRQARGKEAAYLNTIARMLDEQNKSARSQNWLGMDSKRLPKKGKFYRT